MKIIRIQGRTLVELMVTMVIGLIIIGSIWAIYMATQRTSRSSDAINQINEDAAIAMALVSSHLKMSGYSQLRAIYSPTSLDEVGGPNQISDRNFGGISFLGCDQGFTSTTTEKFEDLGCRTGSSAGRAAFAVRYEADAAHLSSSSAVGAPVDCLGQALEKTAASDFDKKSYWLIENRFFISAEGSLSCAGNGAAGGFISQPLIKNVESMQLRFAITSNMGFGHPIAFLTQQEMDAGNINWRRVVGVRVCLVLQGQGGSTEDSSGYINCDGNNVSISDNILRKSFSSFFSFRNNSEYQPKF